MDLSIIIPVYNERDNLLPVTAHVMSCVKPWNRSVEILFVDDGSSDGSSQLLDDIAAEHPSVRAVHHGSNLGFGAALSTAYRAARGTVVASMDADMSHDASQFAAMLEEIGRGADIVVGSRHLDGGGMSGVASHRRFISAVARRFIRLLFRLPIGDATNGFRAAKRAAVLELGLKCRSFDLLPEMIITGQRRGLSIKEVPMTLGRRRHGFSKLTWRDCVSELATLLRLRLAH